MTKEERRDQILTAAASIFFVNGFEGAKMSEIAKMAGIGKGTLYEYFNSKEDLYNETVKNLRDTYKSKFQEILEPGNTFREKIISFTKYQIAFTKQYLFILPELTKTNILAREIGTIILEMGAITNSIIKEILLQAIDNNEVRADLDIEIATSMIVGTINQYFSKKAIIDSISPDSLHYEKVIDNLLTGIGSS